MVRIIVAAHGGAAPALLDTGTMILGEMPNTFAVTFLPGQGPEDLLEQYTQLTSDNEPTLFLVDLFGGSPYNAAARFAAERENTEVVAGVNIPMLMEVTTSNKRANTTLEKLVAKALKAGQTGVRGAKKPKATPLHNNAAKVKDSSSDDLASTSGKPATITDFPRDPNKTMNCIFMRIDSRLIHGQVAGAWVSDKQPQTLIAASDNAAQDALRKELLLQVGPASARTNVLDLAKTVRVYFNPDYKNMKTMIVVERPQDALQLIKNGIKVKELNVGGVTYKEGMQQISEAVYADDAQLAAYKELDELGVSMVLQQVPSSQRVNLMDRLQQKGLV